jgi:hypothetical protein
MQSASAAAAKVESLRTTIFSSLLRANAEDVWPESERRAHAGLTVCRAENSSSATGWQADVSSTMMRG